MQNEVDTKNLKFEVDRAMKQQNHSFKDSSLGKRFIRSALFPRANNNNLHLYGNEYSLLRFIYFSGTNLEIISDILRKQI